MRMSSSAVTVHWTLPPGEGVFTNTQAFLPGALEKRVAHNHSQRSAHASFRTPRERGHNAYPSASRGSRGTAADMHRITGKPEVGQGAVKFTRNALIAEVDFGATPVVRGASARR